MTFLIQINGPLGIRLSLCIGKSLIRRVVLLKPGVIAPLSKDAELSHYIYISEIFPEV